mmetsp:Transcript_73081/g.138126  ORF Transcript_73081/g.138126 Transcript_73081/m.138126 type:complete len:148 (+) Transcript_73081:209-652(+)
MENILVKGQQSGRHCDEIIQWDRANDSARPESVRISGVLLPNRKKINIALTAIYGIGKRKATYVLESSGVELDTKVENLTPGQIRNIRNCVESFKTEGSLRREKSLARQRLVAIGTRRGMRNEIGLPSRGQRTQTNAHSARSLRKKY